VIVPLVLATGAGGASASCVPAAAKTLRASGAARIYSQRSVLHGCLGTRRTRLGPLRGTVPFPATRVTLYALSNRYAGIDTVQMGVDTFSSEVALVDLRTGAKVATAPATTPERRAESFIMVTSMAVNDTGTLAWIGRRSAIGVPQPTYELHALTAGHNVVVSAGTIPLVALRLDEKKLSWREGSGGPGESVPLPP